MLRLFLTYFLFFIFFPIEIYAQQSMAPPYQYGRVSKEDLSMKVYEPDTSASAVVLCDYGNVWVEMFTDGSKLRSEFYRRIKILQRSAFNYGDVAIPFYSFKNQEQFFFDKAMIHLPNGDKVKLKKKDVFIEQVNDYVSVAKFTFPQMEEGCIIEYSYFMNSESILELVDWYFQEDIPVRYSEIRADFPKYYAYSYLFQGNEGMEKVKEEENGAITYAGKNGTIYLGDRQFIMRDAPAMRPEAYITTMDDYRARIRFQLSEIRYADGRREAVMSTWPGLKEELDHYEYFGHQYLHRSNYKDLVEAVLPLATGLETQEAKAKFFYDHLMENVEWNGRFRKFTRAEKLSAVYLTKEGSSAELSLMLLVLLRESGITAYPLITSTRDNGRMHENYPLLNQFNHTMVFAMVDRRPTLIDLTDPLRPFGLPSVAALNNRGLLIKDNGSPDWMDIKPPRNSADIYAFDLALSESGSISGECKGVYKGYNAVPERRHYQEDLSAKHWRDRLSGQFTEMSISDVKTGNLDKLEEAFSDTLQLTIEDAAQVAGDFIYLPAVMHSSFAESPFKQPERLFPVDIPYPFSEQYIMKIKIPEGYAVEELPERVRVGLPNGAGAYSFAAEEKEPGLVVVASRIHLTTLLYMPDEYPAVKELFDSAAQHAQAQIVLKKK